MSGSGSEGHPRPPRPGEDFVEVWQRSSAAEFIRAMADGALASAGHFDHVGLEVVKAEEGRVELAWTPGAHLCNPGGVVHGGYVSIALDDAAGLASASDGERFLPMLTMDLRIEYLRPVLPEVRHTVVGTLVHPGRTRRVADARVEDPEGRLIARAAGSFTFNRAYKAAADARAGGSA
jgi:uncharacterized protein (TIGR00369 family)